MRHPTHDALSFPHYTPFNSAFTPFNSAFTLFNSTNKLSSSTNKLLISALVLANSAFALYNGGDGRVMETEKTLLVQQPIMKQDNKTIDARVRWTFRNHLAMHLADNRGKTLQNVADEIGVHRNTVFRWKNTDYLPQIEDKFLARICSTFNVKICELLELELELS